MKRVRPALRLYLLLMLCLLFMFPASAETVTSRSSIVQNYKNMQTAFDRGAYDIAYLMAKEIYQEDAHYELIDSYYHYLLALEDYLPNGRYIDAFNEFDVLSIAGFAKSAGYAAYARGLQYEQDQQYDNAIAMYQSAIQNGIGDAQERIRVCASAQREKAYQEAGFQAEQGNYKVAGDLFYSLIGYFPDAQQKANENYYKAAELLSKAGAYADAADLFTQLGSYLDSREKAIQNRTWATSTDNPATLGLRLESADATSLALSWKNELKIEKFQVSYEPTGMASLNKKLEVTEPTCTITGLIPNTEYTVTVLAIGGSGREQGSFFTQQAAAASESKYQIRTVYLGKYDASLQGVGLLNLLSTKAEGMYQDLSSGMAPLTRKPSQSNDRYFVSASFYRAERVPQSIEFTYVLRLNGKYSSHITFTAECGDESFPYFPADVTGVMDSFWDNFEGAGESLSVDAYIDGQYLCTNTVRIGK